MPEGPEVRHNAEQLRVMLLGRNLTAVKPISGKLQRLGIPNMAVLKELLDLMPLKVVSVQPHGKLIVISLEGGRVITSSLGMSGWWYPPDEEQQAKRLYAHLAYKDGKLQRMSEIHKRALTYTRVMLMCGDEPLAAFTDPRNFGNFEVHGSLEGVRLSDRIGFDLLNDAPYMAPEAVNAKLLELKRTAPKRLQNMKLCNLALEQSFIAGLGNIYRAEAIWLARLDPFMTLAELTDEEWLKFCEVGSTVLQIAYTTAGTMRYPNRYIEELTGASASQPDGFTTGHLVYGKQRDIFGRPVSEDKSNGRTLWYVQP